MRGIRLLTEYLKAKDESISSFARRSGLDRVWLQRLIKHGHPKRISVGDAKAIHDATEGAVPWHSFAEAA